MSQKLYQALFQACSEVGIVPPETLPPLDGQWHPADLEGDSRGKGDGRILLFADGQGGHVHNWKGGAKTFAISRGKRLLPEEQKEFERRRQAALCQKGVSVQVLQEKARIKAKRLWSAGTTAKDDHPYLQRKGIRAYNLRVGRWIKWRKSETGSWERHFVIENALFVPLLDEKGQIWNLQAIFPERHPGLGRDKDFISGGRKTGLSFPVGNTITNPIFLAEGLATGVTIHEETGKTAVVAFDAGNLEPVAKIIRRSYPALTIIVCADNDRHTDGNPGLTKARAAARAIGGKVCIPCFSDGQSGTDFNDLLRGCP